MLNDYFQFTIAEHYISALINSDYSGLDDAECTDFDNFISAYKNLKNATWDVDNTEPHFSECVVCGLYAACIDVKLHFTNEFI